MGEPRTTVERLAAVDALRGLAAAVVFFHHLRTLFPALDARLADAQPGLHAVLSFVSRRNVEAVLLFFVLSGFSIGLSVAQRSVVGRSGLRTYYARRLWRIVPLYWFALLVSGVVAAWVAPVPTEALALRTWVGNLLFLQTATGTPGQWFVPYAANAALWSLSFEMFFYLAYPWLVRGVATATRRSVLVAGVTAVGLVWGALAPNPFAMFCAASLIWYCGAELALLHTQGRMGVRVAVYGALGLVLAGLRYGLELPALHGLAVGCAWLVLGYVALVRRLLGWSPRLLVWLGSVSYGLYLLHVPVMRAMVAWLGQSPGSAVLAVVVSLALAQAAEQVARRGMRVALE